MGLTPALQQLRGRARQGRQNYRAGTGRGERSLLGHGLEDGLGKTQPTSPQLGVENLTTKGSRLKASSGSGYWYVSTTDTASFLGAVNWRSAEPTPGPCTLLPAAPLASPVDVQVHLLVVVPTQWLAAHKAVLVFGHAVERRARCCAEPTIKVKGSRKGFAHTC